MRQAVSIVFKSLVVVIIQTTLVHFLSFEGIFPDLVLIWIVYLAITEGQATAVTSGFALGLIVDMMSGKDGMLGLAALTGTTAGFVAGFFHDENRISSILVGYQFLLVVAVTSFVHSILYFFIFLQGTDTSVLDTLLSYGLPTTLYTTVVALLPMLVFSRRLSSTL
jgi:rod shape-determining protein MreD